jgi:hypothetical protein
LRSRAGQGKLAAHAAGLYLHGLGDALQNLRVDLGQFGAAGLGRDLDLAGGLEDVHGQKGIGNRGAAGQQTVVAQHEEVGLAHVGQQTRLSSSRKATPS